MATFAGPLSCEITRHTVMNLFTFAALNVRNRYYLGPIQQPRNSLYRRKPKLQSRPAHFHSTKDSKESTLVLGVRTTWQGNKMSIVPHVITLDGEVPGSQSMYTNTWTTDSRIRIHYEAISNTGTMGLLTPAFSVARLRWRRRLLPGWLASPRQPHCAGRGNNRLLYKKSM